MRILFFAILFSSNMFAAIPDASKLEKPISIQEQLEKKARNAPTYKKSSLVFDIPVTYNRRVSFWIEYFQTKGRSWFNQWLERSSKYLPFIQQELKAMHLPQDLAFMVMVESGFNINAESTADAVGPWQFIQATGNRYGLKVNWWLDERRDLHKSTLAAISYIRDLNREFGSWYLVAASYNMGENGLRRKIKQYQTRDFWALSRMGALPVETMDYVPKILAAMLITKSPGLYGFTEFARLDPFEYDVVQAPSGTDLADLADHLGVTRKSMQDLNAELIVGYIPSHVKSHTVRVPKGAVILAGEYFNRVKIPRKYSKANKNSVVR